LKRIFIADDSDVLRARLIEIISEIEGIEIVGEAENAEKVLDAERSLKPDILILDIRMQSGNGILALETIKKRKNPPIVIMFTNYPYLQYRKKCFDAGADYFFFKATEFENLVELLKQLTQSADIEKK